VLTTHRPSVAVDEFRAAMRQIPSVVTIVTTSVHGFRHGLTATAVASVSVDPPQVLVCVHRATRSATAISAAGRFGLNFLSAEHAELAEAFAAPIEDPEDRFRLARWKAGPSGTPLLVDALVAFECVVVNEISSGTHLILVGQVADVRCREGRALIYQRGAFTRPEAHAEGA
jgi:flavin reductase (DIM6/NTAB) family NADH-FMN oxidoreductase RutF